jgi:acetylornithine deacetylase/succinyl-diaminopimelate desuccinylase family protein
MYHAHIDTVPAGELNRWKFDPFEGKLEDGKIFGRGAGDDKACVAAQVIAVVTLARANIQLGGCLKIAIVSDEESGGQQGTKWMHDEGLLDTDALVVGEQTNNHVAIAERVACGIDLTVYGKSAHGATPWAGENAVVKAAAAINWIREHLFPELDKRQHPYLPPPTLNIGKISGGIQWSIVPECCKVEMDRRLLPGETREVAMEEIREVLDKYHHQVESLNYELFSTGEVAANIDTPSEHPFAVLASHIINDISRESRSLTGYEQTSDGRWFARDGIPILIFGPSNPAVAHSTDEFVPVDQLLEATWFYTLLALRWLKL